MTNYKVSVVFTNMHRGEYTCKKIIYPRGLVKLLDTYEKSWIYENIKDISPKQKDILVGDVSLVIENMLCYYIEEINND